MPHESEEDIVYINGLNKCVTIKDNVLKNKDIRILGCKDSYVYVDTNVEYL